MSRIQYLQLRPCCSPGVAYLLWLAGLFFACGLHRFYLGKPYTGLRWLGTLGLLGIGQITDLFRLRKMIAKANRPT